MASHSLSLSLLFLLTFLLHVAVTQELCSFEPCISCGNRDVFDVDPSDSGDIELAPASGRRSLYAAYQAVSDAEIVPKEQLRFEDSTRPIPWRENRTLVWRSSSVTERLHQALSRQIPGIAGSVTAMDVLQQLQSRGCKIYLVGGLVRDALAGEDILTEAKDIDINFACSSAEAAAIAEEANFNPARKGHYVRIPDELDRDNKKDVEGFPVDASLYQSVTLRDFACNTLWYELDQDIIIDRTGLGVQNAIEKVLRATVPDLSSWTIMNQKPGAKLVRWFKFRSRGFRPYNDELLVYQVRRILEFFDKEGQKASDSFEKQLRASVRFLPSAEADMTLQVWYDALLDDFRSALALGVSEATEEWAQTNVYTVIDYLLSENDARLQVYRGVTRSSSPQVTFVAGGTASGKSSIRERDELRDLFPQNAVVLDSDAVLTAMPAYTEFISSGTQEGRYCAFRELSSTSFKITTSLLQEAAMDSYNVVIDRTMLKLTKSEQDIEFFRSLGYRIELVGVTTDTELAAERSYERAEDEEGINYGRWVPLSYLVQTHARFSANFLYYSELVDRALLVDRNEETATLIYDSVLDNHVLDDAAFTRFLNKQFDTEDAVAPSLSDDSRNAFSELMSTCYGLPPLASVEFVVEDVAVECSCSSDTCELPFVFGVACRPGERLTVEFEVPGKEEKDILDVITLQAVPFPRSPRVCCPPEYEITSAIDIGRGRNHWITHDEFGMEEGCCQAFEGKGNKGSEGCEITCRKQSRMHCAPITIEISFQDNVDRLRPQVIGPFAHQSDQSLPFVESTHFEVPEDVVCTANDLLMISLTASLHPCEDCCNASGLCSWGGQARASAGGPLYRIVAEEFSASSASLLSSSLVCVLFSSCLYAVSLLWSC